MLSLPLAYLEGWNPRSASISLFVLRLLIGSMATLALKSGLCVRRLIIDGSPDQRLYRGSAYKDWACAGKSAHLTRQIDDLTQLRLLFAASATSG